MQATMMMKEKPITDTEKVCSTSALWTDIYTTTLTAGAEWTPQVPLVDKEQKLTYAPTSALLEWKSYNIFLSPSLKKYPWTPLDLDEQVLAPGMLSFLEEAKPSPPLPPLPPAYKYTPPHDDVVQFEPPFHFSNLLEWIESIMVTYTRNGFISLVTLDCLLIRYYDQYAYEMQKTFLGDRLDRLVNMITYSIQFELHFMLPICIVSLKPGKSFSCWRTFETPVNMFALTYHYSDYEFLFKNNSNSLDFLSNHAADSEVMIKVALHSWDILRTMKNNGCTMAVKSVELANEIRLRIGAEGFQLVKAHYVGYLNFLETFPHLFKVVRIPKEDMVALCPLAEEDIIFDLLFRELHDSCDGNFDLQGPRMEVGPTRSLYLSNVPIEMTESSFHDELTSLSPISISLFSQRDRRYGFLNFDTVVQASDAKRILEGTKSWKSNVEYAMKQL